MRARAPLLALMLLAFPAAYAAGDGVCASHAERVEINGIALRAEAGAQTFYLITTGSRTIGQSTFELWHESNGLDGLQTWPGECGAPADRFLASACALRLGAVGELECPAASTGDLAGLVG